jgi:hypothetical protein
MIYAVAALAVMCMYLANQCHLKDRRIRALEADTTGLVERLWGAASSERQLLLNRIQAPEVAVAQTIDAEGEAPRQFTRFDDDEDFHDAMKTLEPDGVG